MSLDMTFDISSLAIDPIASSESGHTSFVGASTAASLGSNITAASIDASNSSLPSQGSEIGRV